MYYPWVHTKGGAEKVFLQIAQALSVNNKVDLFTGYYNPSNTFKELKQFNVKVIKPGLNVKNFFTRGVSSLIHYLFGRISLNDYDALIVCTGGVGELILLGNHSKPSFIYCYTPLRVAHQFYDYYMKKSNLIKKIFLWFGVKAYRLLEKLSWKYARYVMCDSKNTMNNVLAANLIEKGKMEVVYPGVDLKDFSVGKLSKKYFLVTGRYMPYKRFELAIDSFNEFKKKIKGYKLVIAGSINNRDYFEKIKRTAESVGDVEIKTDIPQTEMIALYKNCFAYLFTAENEDFGIVPIEAMACGKPVISVDEGGAKETVLDGKTGFLVKASYKNFAEKMFFLVNNKKQYHRMSELAVKRAKEFDLNNFNKKMEDIVYKLLPQQKV